jgi:diguanylate cyclase (GGDEF)-like protein
VYFVDLDGFKLVNDSRGHTAGDQVIFEVAERLRGCIPARASIGRVGGDEFVVAHQATWEEAVVLADTILATLRHTLTMPAANVVISASIGVAHSAGTMTAEDLLRDADIAMYQAKASGRDAWKVFDPEMRDKIKERIDTDVALREALHTGQLELAYQPIVRIATGEITGAEALIRWNHPTEGCVPPSRLISVAEESGLIVEIGQWVIREAITQLATWRALGHVASDFVLSFNVSPRQLRDPQLAAELAEMLATSGVPGEQLVVELTESVMIDTANGAAQAMDQLRSLGVRLVVDDFGTGFSALGYLRKYPLNGVKIDRSFVAGLGSQSEDQAIVHAVVAMSAALRLGVVAEGIEKPEQRDMLHSLGVIYGQGWLWGAAVDAQTFTQQWSRMPSPSAV